MLFMFYSPDTLRTQRRGDRRGATMHLQNKTKSTATGVAEVVDYIAKHDFERHRLCYTGRTVPACPTFNGSR